MVLPHGSGDLYHKYRPRRFNEVAGHTEVIKSIKRAVAAKDPARAYLLIGDSGTGKTTTARIMSLAVNCEKLDNKDEPCLKCRSCKAIVSGHTTDIIEVNAADHRGINDIRSLCSSMSLMPLQLKNKVYILDECFPGETMVMVDYNNAVPIKQVVENEHITHVLAYDLKAKAIRPQKITKRYKRPYDDYIVKVLFKDGTYIRSTSHHKYYVPGRGYVQAKNLTSGDKLVEYAGDYKKSSSCPHCGKLFSRLGKKVSGHIMKCRRSKTSHTLFSENNAGHEVSKETRQRISTSSKKFLETEEGKLYCAAISERQNGSNNSIFTYMTPSEVSSYLSERQKKWWANLSEEERSWRTKTFINAPKYKNLPNSCEQEVISWGVTGLKYVGDGSLFVTLTFMDGTSVHKNPDFVYKEGGKVKKIVEVMDFEYWHSRKEASKIVKAYRNIGYECLVIDAARVKNDPNVRGEIESFVNNHYREVEDVIVEKYKYRGAFVYDLEVADDHNFFVVPAKYKKHSREGQAYPYIASSPILVSNCHQLTQESQSSLLKELEEAPNHVFIILCSTHPNKILPTVKNRCQHFKFNSLRKNQIKDLIREVSAFETYELVEAHFDLIASAAGGSPRRALVLLQQISQLGSSDPEAIGRLLNTEDAADKDVFALCFQLDSPKRRWLTLMETFEQTRSVGAPGIGMMIAGYYRNKLIKATSAESAELYSKVLELFVNPLADGKLGENQLVLNLYKALSSLNGTK